MKKQQTGAAVQAPPAQSRRSVPPASADPDQGLTSAQAAVEGLEGSSLHIRVVMRTVYGDGTLEV